MNVMKAMRAAEPAPTRRLENARPASATTNAPEVETRQTHDERDADGITRRAARPEFAALLALLAGAGPRVRADLLQQMTPEGASLVDRLLDGGGAEEVLEVTGQPGAESTALNATPETLVMSALQGSTPSSDQASETLRYGMIQVARDPQPSVTERRVSPSSDLESEPQNPPTAVLPGPDEALNREALRSGILNLQPQQPLRAVVNSDVIDLAAYARAREAQARSGMTGVERVASELMRRAVSPDEQALSVFTRVATQRGTSLEQLIALGDGRGADARAAIDALLAHAGTTTGLRLAERPQVVDQSPTATSIPRVDPQSVMETEEQTGGAVEGAAETINFAASTYAQNAERQAELAVGHAAEAQAAHLVAAEALVAALNASADDVTTPRKSLDGVAPELRSRVDRVIDRMKSEYGHDVAIVESVRSQARQDYLFEQGRSRPGQIVTWTQDSAHTRGEAVDVIIDGAWTNAAGFARLQRIAREEGLRTLGMKDPGHLELPHDLQHTDRAAAVATKIDARVDRLSDQSQMARVAQVADVAPVASVARVADASGPSGSSAPLQANASAYAAQANLGSQSDSRNGGNNSNSGDSAKQEGQKSLNVSKKSGSAARTESADDHSAFGTFSSSGMGAGATATPRVGATAPAAGSEQAQRVSDVQQLRADAPASPLTRMTLNVENANGTQERITVDLRGNTVDTFITTNAANVDKLRMHSGELQEALSRQGLDGETVTVRAATKSDSADAVRSMVSERDALKLGAAQASTQGDGANSNSQRDRTPSRDTDKQDDARREQANRARDDKQQDGQPRGRRNPFTGTE